MRKRFQRQNISCVRVLNNYCLLYTTRVYIDRVVECHFNFIYIRNNVYDKNLMFSILTIHLIFFDKINKELY